MNCPACRADLHLSERQGIEIDYCPACGGLWLDRGELEKIIERSAYEYRPRNYNRGYSKKETHDRSHNHNYYIDPETGKK